MTFDSLRHHPVGTLRSRRSIRLKDYDYAQAGAYFVTIVTWNRECVLGEVVDRAVELSPIGQTAYDFWQEIPRHFANADTDEFIVMPNHIHGILVIGQTAREPVGDVNGDHAGVEYGRNANVGVECFVGVEYIQPLRGNQPTHPNQPRRPDVPPRSEPPQIEPRHAYQHVIPKSVGSIIRTYKAAVTRWCNKNGSEHFAWQRNYYEHVIRDENDLERIRNYIASNPANWSADDENPGRSGRAR